MGACIGGVEHPDTKVFIGVGYLNVTTNNNDYI